jgi:Uma2 family endonuclease
MDREMTATQARKRRPIRQSPAAHDGEDLRFCVVVPTSATTLAGFRAWSSSDAFPETGTITFAGGEIIIDMSPERIHSHGEVKAEVCHVVGKVIRDGDRGKLYLDRIRFVHVDAGVSNEPEALFVSWEALTEKRVIKVPTKDQKDFIEFEGTPDWVLEIVSPSSVVKDTVILLERYHRAKIPEYWLIDARGNEVQFQILYYHPDGYRLAPSRSGWQKSKVFGKQFRLVRYTDRVGDPAYRLEVK